MSRPSSPVHSHLSPASIIPRPTYSAPVVSPAVVSATFASLPRDQLVSYLSTFVSHSDFASPNLCRIWCGHSASDFPVSPPLDVNHSTFASPSRCRLTCDHTSSDFISSFSHSTFSSRSACRLTCGHSLSDFVSGQTFNFSQALNAPNGYVVLYHFDARPWAALHTSASLSSPYHAWWYLSS